MTTKVSEDEIKTADKTGAELRKEDNRILDARMEYGHLMSNYMSLVNMFWIGYGAFFTINSLFATALGISYSANAQAMDRKFLFLIHVLIPLAGIFISFCAIYAAVRIVKSQGLIEERGRQLEDSVLNAAIFHGLEKHSQRSPVYTIVGALFFAALWISAFFAIKEWPF